MTVSCPSCGLPVELNARACSRCGTSLTPHDEPTRTARPDTDETRLASSPRVASSGSSSSGSGQAATLSSGWLSSSGAIDHGRFEPGTLLGGRYRMVGRLGKGGMGEVFRADDLKLGQPVALKFLAPDVDRDPARLTQLHTEVRMARQVSHPNVCRVYDIDEVDGHTFLSMEYIDGEDLASLLRRVGRFPEERGIAIARQICAGLAAAHERGVLHRDFKPANVMLDSSGQVRITDFGLAGLAGEALRAGTPAYMAPEQLAGAEVTVRSDIYALGLVLYEIFTGRRALDAKNLAELIRRREQAEIVPPSMIVRDLSPEIDVAVMRCLAPAPAARPASAILVSASLPGGDPLAVALAAGETPSPEMVAAAGEEGGLSRRAGIPLLAFVFLGLLATAAMSDRIGLLGRVPLEKSADVLEDRAREILARVGYPRTPGADSARGAGITNEQLSHFAGSNQSQSRWDWLPGGKASVLRFWYRTSPRPLEPLSPSWTPQMNDPPLAVSGMATIVVDEQGRLVELVSMPSQLETTPGPSDAFDWKILFDAAGLPIETFSPVEPQWTPRVFADKRVAWEGPHPAAQELRIRVEGAEYRGKPVAFQIVGPWTRPLRMEQSTISGWLRAINLAGTAFLVTLLVGAVALVRHNLKSGRADRQGAMRVALFVMGAWIGSWIFGARHSFALDKEIGRFFTFFAFALLNTGITWMLYLALEPFVRRFFPGILISWSRLVQGQFRDPRVGRDVLIGIAVGVLLSVARNGTAMLPAVTGGTPLAPFMSGVQFLLGSRFVVSGLLRVIPNALQTAMLSTFAFVMVRALVRRNWIAVAIASALLAGVILAESEREQLGLTIFFVVLVVVPIMFIFMRFGLLALAAALATLQALNTVTLTIDTLRPHAGASAFTMLVFIALAAYAFHVSRAGRGIFRGLI